VAGANARHENMQGDANVARKVVGLDIGTTAVRAAEVSVRRGQAVLERIGQAGLPEGVVVDGEVIDPDAVAAAIKDLWRRTRISSRRVIIGVANQRVVVRLVDLPWMQPDELRSSLGFQASDYLPIPVDQTELDYAVLGASASSPATPSTGSSPRSGADRSGPRAAPAT
jgi:type IV pilus assembly protein PilM